jgi:hypothetical protein
MVWGHFMTAETVRKTVKLFGEAYRKQHLERRRHRFRYKVLIEILPLHFAQHRTIRLTLFAAQPTPAVRAGAPAGLPSAGRPDRHGSTALRLPR